MMTHPEDKPLSSKLSEELLNYIRSENLKPGDRLPTNPSWRKRWASDEAASGKQ